MKSKYSQTQKINGTSEEETAKPEDFITNFIPEDLTESIINFLRNAKNGAQIIYNENNIIDIYSSIVTKFLDINPPMQPFEKSLNESLFHVVLQDLCWLLIYDLIPDQYYDEELKSINNIRKDSFSMNFSQLDKKMLNTKIIFSGIFLDLWSVVVSSTILSFFLVSFQNKEFSNVQFVKQIEQYINTSLIGFPPQNLKEYHKSVLGLIKKETLSSFPKFIVVNEPSLIPKNSENKDAKIIVPKNKPLKRLIKPYDRSGVPISQSAEVFKKKDLIAKNYDNERIRNLYQLCAQEEFYMESKDTPPFTPLGITFEDFPKPHLPLNYYNPRNPRNLNIKRVPTFRTSKNAPKRRYRVIPEPEETIAKIAMMNDDLVGDDVFN